MPEIAIPWEEPTPSSTTTFWAAGALAIIATVVGAILPVLIGVWQRQAGLKIDEAGLVGATELFAQVAGTGLFLWATRRWSIRAIAVAGLLILLVGNVATAASSHYSSLLLARAAGGIGGGILRALGMMCLAKAVSPGRAFAVYAAAQVSLAAATTAVIPHLIDAYGARAPFLALSFMPFIGFALCPFIPRLPARGSIRRRRHATPIPGTAIVALVALFIYFVGQGALWTYLAPIGTSLSIPSGDVSRALTLLNVAGLAGALGIGALAHRVRPRVALLILLTAEVLSIAGLFNVPGSVAFIVFSCVFYFSWCASFPFQFTLISRADRSGRASAIVPAADGLGLAAGAATASLVLPALGLASAGWLCGAASIIGVALYVWSATMSARPMHGAVAAVESDAAMEQ